MPGAADRAAGGQLEGDAFVFSHPRRRRRPATVLDEAQLARTMEVEPARVSGSVNGQTSVTGDAAMRLAEAFGTSAEFWMRLQADYDPALAREGRTA